MTCEAFWDWADPGACARSGHGPLREAYVRMTRTFFQDVDMSTVYWCEALANELREIREEEPRK